MNMSVDMSEKDYQSYLKELYEAINSIKEGMSTWKEAYKLRDKYGLPYISFDTFRKGSLILKEFNDGDWVREPVYTTEKSTSIAKTDTKEVTEILKDGSIGSEKVIIVSPKDIGNSEVLLKAHGFNPDKFTLISARNSKWNVGNEVKYSSRITVKPIDNVINKLDIDYIKEYFKDYKINHYDDLKPFTNYAQNSKSLLVTMFDVHFGRWSNINRTGESYNLVEARDRMIKGTKTFIEKFKNDKFEEIVIPIGQDFFNSEATGSTSSGRHKQDNCCDFQTMFKLGTESLIEVISMFSEMAPVKVIAVPGNHSYDAETCMFEVIRAYFRNDKKVTLDVNPSYRKYHIFGKNLMGFTHGADEQKRIWSLMSVEVPGYWAMADYRYFFTGHQHHLCVDEDHGIELWTVPAVVSADAWATKSGYIAKPKAMCFIFDKYCGMEETHYINF